ncbi:hypothetical protein C6P46_002243 [Rhodotorula mucilaginosa]|uniref:Uncharacterized protein n=1 Tax=Rhodotorula mucilaginosa TaxID=5537 RepID=A0A9P6W623_RHOMI|nr:hypothetical protein C6P46_002243 [Rhodotorula mucilaginosa]
MSRIATKRLQKELSDLQTKGCPTGCRVVQAENLEEWIIAVRVLGETVYEGEEFALASPLARNVPVLLSGNRELTKCHCPVCGTTAVPVQLAVPDRYTSAQVSSDQDGREIDTSMSTLFLQDNAVDVGELQKGTCASISSSSPHTATDGPGLPSAEGAPAR